MQICKILGVNVSVTNMEKTVQYLINNLELLRGQYICVSNVFTTVTAYRNPDYLSIQNSAVACLPDGNPLSQEERRRGFKDAERVTGPSLMLKILNISKEKKYKHVFYGSTKATLEKMKNEIIIDYPGIIDNCLFISPEFSSQVPIVNDETQKKINSFRPDFIWVGLGAPKQERWMFQNKGKFLGVSIGVGAAFDYLAKNIKRAPKWMQKLSLEWLFRLIQNPKLFVRYWKTNLSFINNAVIRKK